MKKIFKLVGFLLLIGAIITTLLIFTREVTPPLVEQTDEDAMEIKTMERTPSSVNTLTLIYPSKHNPKKLLSVFIERCGHLYVPW
jgi:hypothetical protein